MWVLYDTTNSGQLMTDDAPFFSFRTTLDFLVDTPEAKK
jgi:hypothetical protein